MLSISTIIFSYFSRLKNKTATLICKKKTITNYMQSSNIKVLFSLFPYFTFSIHFILSIQIQCLLSLCITVFWIFLFLSLQIHFLYSILSHLYNYFLVFLLIRYVTTISLSSLFMLYVKFWLEDFYWESNYTICKKEQYFFSLLKNWKSFLWIF